jgi:hypothetical protein
MIQRLVVASPGGWNAPSTRYRVGPIASRGPWPVEALSAGSFPTGQQIEGLLQLGGRDAALILQRVLPATRDLERLRITYDRLLFDVDDAIYAVPPDLSAPRLGALAKKTARVVMRGSPHASARKRRLERTLQSVDVCVVGNAILGDFARRFARQVVEIPTTVQPVAAPPTTRPKPPVCVWMGLPDNLQHLILLHRPLQQLRREIDFRLRIISSHPWENPPFEVEFVPWSETAAHRALLDSSIGLAPLTDDPWTRGKCAFRSIQYGGHGLPTVASPVGITDLVVRHGSTGYLARNEDDWLGAMRSLVTDEGLVHVMGAAALNHVRTFYSDELALRRWVELLQSLESH